jgi:hypothetical protein
LFLDAASQFGPMVLGQTSWGLLAFPAAFVTAGAVLAPIIMVAARAASARGGACVTDGTGPGRRFLPR